MQRKKWIGLWAGVFLFAQTGSAVQVSAQEAPASAEEASNRHTGFLGLLGLPPAGSFLYATAVAEFGLNFGSWPGVGGFGVAFHYAERGGLLASSLFAGLATTSEREAALERAARSGRPQYYRVYSVNDFPDAGLNIDVFSTHLGSDSSGLNVDLFLTLFEPGSRLPWAIDLGLHAHIFNGPDETIDDSMGGTQTITHEAGGVGLFLGVLFPVTRWAQGQVIWRPVAPFDEAYNPWYTLEASGTVNVGDRLYTRATFIFDELGEGGMLFGVGGRL